ncbi:MAG: thiamine-phosphate kinase [Acidobacteriota bacterium]
MRERHVTVGELGERSLVARIQELLQVQGVGVVQGPGDDAAVVVGAGGSLVLTADSQHEGVHFKLSWIEPRMLGRRVMAINASDIAAMGAEPRWAIAALALPPATPLPWLEELVCGLRAAGEAFGCPVVGGDVAGVPDRLSVTVTVVGALRYDVQPLLRSGAQAGDGCWVTGHPGRAAAGRALLEAGYRRRGDGGVLLDGVAVTDGGAVADAGACLAAYLRPEPPLAMATVIGVDRLADAMIDLSDGLAVDLLRVCEASAVGVLLEADTLASEPALQRWQESGLGDALQWVLGGGEDYQLLCAVPPRAEPELESVARKMGVEARRIGQFLPASRGCRMARAGQVQPLVAAGWNHFPRPLRPRAPSPPGGQGG